jgi:3-oxoacyl-[acyl-carrier protein] reductase
MLLENRTVLITGASRGIGAATARLAARHGAAVAVNYFQSEKAAEEVVDEITSAGGRAVAVQADVREPGEVQAMRERVNGELGPVDTLVVNASISFPVVPFVDFQWGAFEAKLVGELKAAFYCCKVFVPPMLEAGGGTVIGVSSGLSRHPGYGFCAHTTAKSGLDGFMKSLALELGSRGIRVNVVSPGLTETDATANIPAEQKEAIRRMTPQGRVGQPDDVAGAIVLMAADEARFVTGAYLPVSGGTLML